MNFQMFKLALEKAEEPEIKLPTSVGLLKKQESSRKPSISALLTMPKPFTVWITIYKLWRLLQEMGIPDHLTCFLRNLYAGQEATVRTRRGSTGASLVAQMVKRLPKMRETWFQFLGREVPLEKEMETHSSILAWKIPWTEEPGRLQSMLSQRVRHD